MIRKKTTQSFSAIGREDEGMEHGYGEKEVLQQIQNSTIREE